MRRMQLALAHRGPDSRGRFDDSNIGLVSTRLALCDRSDLASQPMVDASGQFCIVFNGEIFNHISIRASLPPYPYLTKCDTETVLHLFATRGVAGLRQLEGFFALAVVNLKTQTLVLARDRLGVKPLYYSDLNQGLAFASEIRALLAAGTRRDIQIDLLFSTLATRWIDGMRTPLRAVRRVEPGTALSVDLATGDVASTRWFEFEDLVDPSFASELEAGGRAGAAEHTRGALAEAVEARARADSRVGTLCSGGLDSSLVTAFAVRALGAVPAYTANFVDQPLHDESSWARIACSASGAECRPVSITAEAWREHLVSAVMHFEYPLVHESSIALSIVARSARADGVTVLLGGEGADELFGGYSTRHAEERRRFSIKDNTTDLDSDLVERDGEDESAKYQRDVARRFTRAYDHHEPCRRGLEVAIASDLCLFLPHGLNRLDKNMMQFGVECREPFLSQSVVRLGLNAPLEWRLEPALKGLLLDVARSVLPPAIVGRPKNGFNIDVPKYLDGSVRHGFLRHGSLKDVIGLESIENYKNATGNSCFRLITAEIWYRAIVEDQSEGEICDALWRASPRAARFSAESVR
jgi:asparagine synthase (glutamine-hydrolysing)